MGDRGGEHLLGAGMPSSSYDPPEPGTLPPPPPPAEVPPAAATGNPFSQAPTAPPPAWYPSELAPPASTSSGYPPAPPPPGAQQQPYPVASAWTSQPEQPAGTWSSGDWGHNPSSDPLYTGTFSTDLPVEQQQKPLPCRCGVQWTLFWCGWLIWPLWWVGIILQVSVGVGEGEAFPRWCGLGEGMRCLRGRPADETCLTCVPPGRLCLQCIPRFRDPRERAGFVANCIAGFIFLLVFLIVLTRVEYVHNGGTAYYCDPYTGECV